jgi:hypothetical protein
MERGAPIAMLRLLRALVRVGLCLALSLAVPAVAEDRLVLLVGADSKISTLSSVDVHKLFLGLTVVVNDQRLHPLRNDSDELMRRIFFQNIVSMSESVYDRRMLALTLQQGRAAPPVLHTTKEVLDALASDADAVSFAWAADAERDPKVRVLRVLWGR